ncbi:MAG: aminotransferase class V-fold PLP-dependent enzyme [Planctomycetota bacterium]|nr:MAG: aminotransferase class V-fold PLP-dependent enzyme [Planctomycetota bacterium]
MNRPASSPLAHHWSLDPDVVFLNQGSYGACPRQVLERRVQLLERSEREPVRFMLCETPGLLDRTRCSLAELVGAREEDLVFLPNVTTAVATVISNLELQGGDEILMNTHEYPACVAIVERAAARAGARVVYAELPFPVRCEDDIVDALVSRTSPRTRLCLVSHVTSPSAMILPVERIVREMQARGVETLVDGAHAPGFCPVDIESLGAGYYTANCHKWLCSPRGSAFLHVRADLQRGFRPLALSVYANNPPAGRSFFNVEFDYIGTQDYTPFMCIADAIEHVPALIAGDWHDVRGRNHELVIEARRLLCQRLGIDPPVPEGMLGSMATVPIPIPPEDWVPGPTRYHDALQDRLIERHGIQVPVWFIADGQGKPRLRFVRISAQLYNSIEQYEYLADALAQELEVEHR